MRLRSHRLLRPAVLLPLLAPLAPLLIPAGSLRAEEAPAPPAIAARQLIDHVQRLASDEWEGRGTGTEGERKATEYIATRLEELGYEAAGEQGTYYQSVAMPGATKLGPGCELELSSPAAGLVGQAEFVVERDFRPFSGSASATVEGELVFAGYGIHAPDLEEGASAYDDYADFDVRGKVVLVLRHLPHAGGIWSKSATRAKYAPFRAKLAEAQERGAAALIVVNDPFGFPTKEEAQARGGRARPRPDTLEAGNVGLGRAKLAVLHMSRAAGARLVALAFSTTLDDLEATLHNQGKPRASSRASGSRVRLRADLETETLLGRNVCGLLRAQGPDAIDEIVVVGAHHDHLGYGMRGSLARSREERERIHNGADDNASGTAGLLEIAAHLSRTRDRLRRSVLVMTFTGEERGLVGSRYFCEQPTVPFGKVVAMINLDMIGRLDGRQLFVGGVKTCPEFRGILKRRAPMVDLDVAYGDGGRAPSDNTSFYNKGKPVLFFFAGMHPDYHRPSDDWDRIDAAGMEKIVRLAAWTAEDIARLPETPQFQRADSGGFGPPRAVLGIQVGVHDKGVLVAAVVPGSGADKAGMVKGDLIVEVAGQPTKDMGALRGVMAKRKIGERITIAVLRGGDRKEFELTLGRG